MTTNIHGDASLVEQVEIKDASDTISNAIRDNITFAAKWMDEGKNELSGVSDPARREELDKRLQVLQGIVEQLESAREKFSK